MSIVDHHPPAAPVLPPAAPVLPPAAPVLPPAAPVLPPVLPQDRAGWDALAHEVARLSEDPDADPARLAATVAGLEAACGLRWSSSDDPQDVAPVVLARRFARVRAHARGRTPQTDAQRS